MEVVVEVAVEVDVEEGALARLAIEPVEPLDDEVIERYRICGIRYTV